MRQSFAGLASRTFRAVSAAALTLAIGLTALPAEAARKAKPNPRFAAIVIDANTGETLYESSPDSPRFPASLTKMMTLYLTFEALKSGKISKDTPVPFSAQAAAMPPTKLGIGAGRSVTVETAILALVTKSANDAAAALGELLGGSEQRFALMMTQKARGLGMSGTEFRNASGLPNPDQHTTARDMARLGVALRQHFPQYYSYFSTPSFRFGRQRMGNHNKLLGRVKGVDGIKTGYTAASGYNLVSSVTDGRKKIVAVVLGGTSGRARDDKMVELINTYLPQASGRGTEGALVAYAAQPSFAAANAALKLPESDAPQPIARRDEAPVAEMEEAIAMPSAERFGRAPAKAAPVKAVPVKAERARKPAPAVDPVETASVAPRSGWVIQVASAPTESGARLILSEIRQKSGAVLASAAPFTTSFKKGNATFFRVRFGGFAGKAAARDACTALKKQRIECFAVQQ